MPDWLIGAIAIIVVYGAIRSGWMSWHTYLDWRTIQRLNGEGEQILTKRNLIAQTIRFGLQLSAATLIVTRLYYLSTGDPLPMSIRTITTVYLITLILSMNLLDQNDQTAKKKLSQHLAQRPKNFNSDGKTLG